MRILQTLKNRMNLSIVLMLCLFLLVAFLILYPLAMVLYGSVWTTSPGAPGEFSLNGYVQTFLTADTYQVIWTTFFLSVVRTFFAVTAAIFFAWVIARTNVPYKGFLELGLLFLFFLPLLPRIMAWILLLSPRTGLINVFLRVLPFDVPSINVFSYFGIIWVGSLIWVPILYIFIAPAFKAMDASMEDSARMSGAGLWTTVRRINLPLLAPAIVATTALGFVRMMESFSVEALLGMRADIFVFTTRIYAYVVHADVPNYPAGMSLATTLLVITFLLVALQWKVLGPRTQYTTVTGRGYQARPVDLGRFRWVAFGIVLLFIVVSMVLPLAVLVWGSFMKISGVFMKDMYTLSHWKRALNDPTLWKVIRNSVVMSISVATVGMILCALISYVVIKTRFIGRRALDLIVWIPWAIPSVVLALGFLWAYFSLPLPFSIYGTLWLMIICLMVKGFPVGTRTMSSTIVQISDELEECARVLGASWTQTFRRIVLPLLIRGFLAGWILLFCFSMKDLATVILLYGPGSSVMATQEFVWWNSGNLEEAIILGLIEASLISVFFIASQLIGGRFSRAVV